MADQTAAVGTDQTCVASIVPIIRPVTSMRVTDERRIAFLLSLSAELSVGCRPRGAIRSHSTGNDRVRSPTSRTLGSNLWNKRGPAARRGIGAGLLGAKGSSFYLSNPIFWTKIVLFATIAGLSIPPTLQLIRWMKQTVLEKDFLPPTEQIICIQRWLRAETAVLLMIPFLTAAMARGNGLS